MSHLRLLNRIHATEIFFLEKEKFVKRFHNKPIAAGMNQSYFNIDDFDVVLGVNRPKLKYSWKLRICWKLPFFFVFVLFHHDDKECKLLKSIVYAQMRNYAKNRTDFIPSHGILHTQFFGKKGRCQSNEIMASNF